MGLIVLSCFKRF